MDGKRKCSKERKLKGTKTSISDCESSWEFSGEVDINKLISYEMQIGSTDAIFILRRLWEDHLAKKKYLCFALDRLR